MRHRWTEFLENRRHWKAAISLRPTKDTCATRFCFPARRSPGVIKISCQATLASSAKKKSCSSSPTSNRSGTKIRPANRNEKRDGGRPSNRRSNGAHALSQCRSWREIVAANNRSQTHRDSLSLHHINFLSNRDRGCVDVDV